MLTVKSYAVPPDGRMFLHAKTQILHVGRGRVEALVDTDSPEEPVVVHRASAASEIPESWVSDGHGHLGSYEDGLGNVVHLFGTLRLKSKVSSS